MTMSPTKLGLCARVLLAQDRIAMLGQTDKITETAGKAGAVSRADRVRTSVALSLQIMKVEHLWKEEN